MMKIHVIYLKHRQAFSSGYIEYWDIKYRFRLLKPALSSQSQMQSTKLVFLNSVISFVNSQKIPLPLFTNLKSVKTYSPRCMEGDRRTATNRTIGPPTDGDASSYDVRVTVSPSQFKLLVRTLKGRAYEQVDTL